MSLDELAPTITYQEDELKGEVNEHLFFTGSHILIEGLFDRKGNAKPTKAKVKNLRTNSAAGVQRHRTQSQYPAIAANSH